MSAATWILLLVGLVVAAIAWRSVDDWRDRRRARRLLLAAMSPVARERAPRCATEPRTIAALAARRGRERDKQLGISPLNWD